MFEDIAAESWRPIPGYEGRYEASSFGQIRTFLCGSWAIRKPVLKRDGRLGLFLSKDGQKKYFQLHTLIATTFHGPRPEGMECCHNDGNPLNNAHSNLRWDTRQANIKDQVSQNKGRRNLRPSEVAEIRSSSTDPVSISRLAAKFGVTHQTISNAIKRRFWKKIA